MFNIEKLTESIAEKVGSELEFDDDKKEVIAYGAFAVLHTMLSIIFVIIFGYLFGVLYESLLIAFSISFLRKYSGGAHANSPETCAIIGMVISVGQALIISFIDSFISFKLFVFLGVIIFIWSFYIIFKLAPVDSEAKPISTEKKKKRMKKGSIIVLNVYIVITILNSIGYFMTCKKSFLILSMCIYGGTMWQAFTLTYWGHLTMNKMDSFFNKILTYIRGTK